MTQTSKIRIKLGDIEIEYEGSEDFLKQELPILIESISKLRNEKKIVEKIKETESSIEESTPNAPDLMGGLGIQSIISRLKFNEHADITFAAAVYLDFTEGKQQFTQIELRESAKTATGYYNKSFASNFSKTIQTLVKNKKLNDLGGGKYAISATAKDQARIAIAND